MRIEKSEKIGWVIPDKTLQHSVCEALSLFELDQDVIVAVDRDAMSDVFQVIDLKEKKQNFGVYLDHIHMLLDKREQGSLKIGPYILCAERQCLHMQDDDSIEIQLTDKEYAVLQLLAMHREDGVQREVLLEKVWDYNDQVETHTLETHMYRLRQKIEHDPSKPEIICTIENGYKLG